MQVEIQLHTQGQEREWERWKGGTEREKERGGGGEGERGGEEEGGREETHLGGHNFDVSDVASQLNH